MITQLSNVFSIFDPKSMSPEKRDALNILHWEHLAAELLTLPPFTVK